METIQIELNPVEQERLLQILSKSKGTITLLWTPLPECGYYEI